MKSLSAPLSNDPTAATELICTTRLIFGSVAAASRREVTPWTAGPITASGGPEFVVSTGEATCTTASTPMTTVLYAPGWALVLAKELGWKEPERGGRRRAQRVERGEATHNSHVGHERNLDPRDLGEEVRPLGVVTHSRAHIVSGINEGPDCVPGVSSSAAGRENVHA